MKDDALLKFECNGAVGMLTIGRPPVNAISFNDWLTFPAKFREFEQQDGLLAVVIKGEGKHFSAGNNRSEFVTGEREDLDRGTAAVRDGLKALASLPLVTIAAINGAAMGSALGIACMCDVRIGTANAMLGLPEVRAGAFGGYCFVRDWLPDGEVRKMQLSGEPINGERAYQLGFLQELVAPENLLPRSLVLAHELTQHLRPEFARKVKQVFLGRANEEMWQDYERERAFGVDYLEAGL